MQVRSSLILGGRVALSGRGKKTFELSVVGQSFRSTPKCVPTLIVQVLAAALLKRCFRGGRVGSARVLPRREVRLFFFFY